MHRQPTNDRLIRINKIKNLYYIATKLELHYPWTAPGSYLDDGLGKVGAVSGRDHTVGVVLDIGLVVALLDKVHVDRHGHAGQLVDAARPPEDVGIVLLDTLDVALEVCVVDGVEADDASPRADVGLGQGVTDQVVVLGQCGLDLVQGVEQRWDVLVIGFLRGREADLVDTVVDRVIDPLVHLIDLGAEGLRVKVAGGVLGCDKVVDCDERKEIELDTKVVKSGHVLCCG